MSGRAVSCRDAGAVSDSAGAVRRALRAREHFSMSLKMVDFPESVHQISTFVNDTARSRAAGSGPGDAAAPAERSRSCVGAGGARRASRAGALPPGLKAPRRVSWSSALAAFALAAFQAAAQTAPGGGVANSQDTVRMGAAELRGLDTLGGATRDLTLAVGATERFGHLEITLDACLAPREAPEEDAYAFLRVRDVREAEPRFSGWMFASSPALSALDHPRYDVWVLSCSNP